MHSIQSLNQVGQKLDNLEDPYVFLVVLVLVFSFLVSSGGYHMGVDKHFVSQILQFISVG
jgi:hypothetical protein